MTLKEIASQAGVSISTVSRILNNPQTTAASAALQAKVRQIAKDSQYTPNKNARSLRIGDKKSSESQCTIYCLFATSQEEVKDDPFYTTLTASIESEAYRQHCIPGGILTSLDLNDTFLAKISESAQTTALIVIGRFSHSLLKQAKKVFQNIVYICLNNMDADCDGIICDGYYAAQDVIQYLHSMGHREIGFIGAHDDSRLTGYLDTMSELELPLSNQSIVYNVPLSMEGGYHGMQRLLDKSPKTTAVFCANDVIAIGALRACNQRNIIVPDDISIIGMNNIENTKYVLPMLTTVSVPLVEMGKFAVRILLDHQDQTRKLPIKVTFPYSIISRDSCCSPRGSHSKR